MHCISLLVYSTKAIDDIMASQSEHQPASRDLVCCFAILVTKTCACFITIAIIIYFNINTTVTTIFCFINFIAICYYCLLYKRPTDVVTVIYYFYLLLS